MASEDFLVHRLTVPGGPDRSQGQGTEVLKLAIKKSMERWATPRDAGDSAARVVADPPGEPCRPGCPTL